MDSPPNPVPAHHFHFRPRGSKTLVQENLSELGVEPRGGLVRPPGGNVSEKVRGAALHRCTGHVSGARVSPQPARSGPGGHVGKRKDGAHPAVCHRLGLTRTPAPPERGWAGLSSGWTRPPEPRRLLWVFAGSHISTRYVEAPASSTTQGN